MRKDVAEAEARHKALNAEARRLQRFIWRKQAHIRATERMMTRGVYCMNDHESDSHVDDGISEDDFRPAAAAHSAAAQSD
jgi:hypothetical protein